MHEMQQRTSLIPGWDPERLGAAHLAVVVAGRGRFAGLLVLGLALIGVEDVTLVVPPESLADGLDAAEAAARHNRHCDVRVVPTIARGRLGGEGGRRVVVLRDLGDPAGDGVDWLDAVPDAIGFARTRRTLTFGTDARAVRRGRLQRPVTPDAAAGAELLILLGELLNAVCAQAGVFHLPLPGDHGSLALAQPPARAHVPLERGHVSARALPAPVLYVAGCGGAIAHQFLLACTLDATLGAALSAPGARIVGADDGVAEESNRSRQYYPAPGLEKAPATAAWLRGLLPGAAIDLRQDRVRAEHFALVQPTHVLSSLDSWGRGGRLLLAELCRDAPSVQELHAAGSDPLGGTTRTLRRGLGACQFSHGAERLLARAEGRRRSCGDNPAPSSVIPQLILGGLAAVELRRSLERKAVDPRGWRVDLTQRGPDGLCFRLGPACNATCDCPGLDARPLRGLAPQREGRHGIAALGA
jgi:hypothetical protein